MNVFTMTARAMGAVQTGQTQAGKMKCMFIVEADAAPGDLPLRFSCVTFGGCAEQCAEIADGDRLFLSGKLLGNAYSKSMNMIVGSMEILTANLAEKSEEK